VAAPGATPGGIPSPRDGGRCGACPAGSGAPAPALVSVDAGGDVSDELGRELVDDRGAIGKDEGWAPIGPQFEEAWVVGPCICWAISAFLLVPIALGWFHTVVSRQFVLEAARDGEDSRVEAKFMYPEDLPPAQLFADQRGVPGDGYWVVAASSVVLGYGCTGGPCIPPPVWSMVVVTDDITTAIASQEIGKVGEQRWPAVFDRLADRAPPETVTDRMVAAGGGVAGCSRRSSQRLMPRSYCCDNRAVNAPLRIRKPGTRYRTRTCDQGIKSPSHRRVTAGSFI
jgi:hypothetical protein